MSGRLVLMPNTLDFGVSAQTPLTDVLPLGAIRLAASLRCWVAENAKTTRAFLKRVDAVAPLAQPPQSIWRRCSPRPCAARTWA
jgi:16S rRNA (cytidine1402-2'-O)-methyltransferase